MKRAPTATLGINVLKNDARSALAIACAVGARFIRVNVHAGAVVADQGLVQSDAHATLRDRRLLGADVQIFADVGGKHAVPLAPVDLEQHARDLRHRGLADGLVVSGAATGAATSLADVKRVRGAVPDVPLPARGRRLDRRSKVVLHCARRRPARRDRVSYHDSTGAGGIGAAAAAAG